MKVEIEPTVPVLEQKNEVENVDENKPEVTEEVKMETDKVDDRDINKFQEGHGIDKGHFTSEIFKIELTPIPKMMGYGDIKNFIMKKQKVKAHKIKYLKQYKKVYICFKNEKDREDGIEKLNGKQLKKEILIAKKASAAKDKMFHKDEKPEKDTKPDLRTPKEKVLDATAPWRRFPYEKQLSDKTNKSKSNCVKINGLLQQATCHKASQVKWPKEKYNPATKLSFRFESCVKSDVIWNYRNKCEFTVGLDGDDKRTVGFRIGKYKDSTVQVESALEVPLIRPEMKNALIEIQKFIQSSPFEPYSPVTYAGHWTSITMRCGGSDTSPYEDGRVLENNENSELLAIFVFVRNEISDEKLEEAKTELIEFSKTQASMTGILFMWKEVRGNQSETVKIFGEETITGSVMGKSFKISPMSFFQTHYHQCSTLYKMLGEWSTFYTLKEKKKVLLDICCGTGSIGIALSDYFDYVYGVEMVESAIEDAKINVRLNNLEKKCDFILGKAEDKVIEICEAASQKKMEIVAIVDPPRAGLPKKVISVLRSNSAIESLIYVSCDSSNKMAQGNIVDLIKDQSKSLRGSPFVVAKAQPVDLFPHTPHHELVFLLLRGGALERFELEESETRKRLELEEKQGIEEESGEKNNDNLEENRVIEGDFLVKNTETPEAMNGE